MLPKRRFWKVGRASRTVFSTHFFTYVKFSIWAIAHCHPFIPNRVLGSMKKCLQNILPAYFSTRANISLGAMQLYAPKRRIWKAERTFGNAFSKHFSNESSPNLVLTHVKSALKNMFPNVCSAFQIIRLGRMNCCAIHWSKRRGVACDAHLLTLMNTRLRRLRPQHARGPQTCRTTRAGCKSPVSFGCN
jgi:hypothetical protein